MKKAIASFSAFFLLVSSPVVFAQMPASVPMPGAIAPSALERIGVVAAASGKVELTTPGQVGRIAQSGHAIYMGDEVTTDEKGHLQILLLDETVFTIGPNSSIIIDQFVYDPKSHAGEIKASITKGVFRYVSGKIAAKDPNAVKVKLPTATLGFRGTIVGGSIGTDGQGLTGLLGPGDNNDAGAQNGSFTVNGDGGGQQEVNRTGFGVQIGEGGSLSGVFQLSDDQINGLTQGLGGGNQGGGGQGSGQGGGSGDQGGGGQGGGSEGGQGGLGGDTNMGNLSGENNALTGENGALMNGLSNLTDGLNNTSILGAQNALNQNAAVTDGTTTFEQLRAASGEGHYANSGSYSGGSGGSIYAQADIVFGPDGFFGGRNSYVEVFDGTYSDRTETGGPDDKSFAGQSGPASGSWSVHSTTGGLFEIAATLSNSGGVTAQNISVQVSYTPSPSCTSGCTNAGSGTVTGTLSPGPSPTGSGSIVSGGEIT